MQEEFQEGDLVVIKQCKHCMVNDIRQEHRKAFEILCETPYPIRAIKRSSNLLYVPVPEGGAEIVLSPEWFEHADDPVVINPDLY